MTRRQQQADDARMTQASLDLQRRFFPSAMPVRVVGGKPAPPPETEEIRDWKRALGYLDSMIDDPETTVLFREKGYPDDLPRERKVEMLRAVVKDEIRRLEIEAIEASVEQ